jgi:hypothetical protein
LPSITRFNDEAVSVQERALAQMKFSHLFQMRGTINTNLFAKVHGTGLGVVGGLNGGVSGIKGIGKSSSVSSSAIAMSAVPSTAGGLRAGQFSKANAGVLWGNNITSRQRRGTGSSSSSLGGGNVAAAAAGTMSRSVSRGGGAAHQMIGSVEGSDDVGAGFDFQNGGAIGNIATESLFSSFAQSALYHREVKSEFSEAFEKVVKTIILQSLNSIKSSAT